MLTKKGVLISSTRGVDLASLTNGGSLCSALATVGGSVTSCDAFPFLLHTRRRAPYCTGAIGYTTAQESSFTGRILLAKMKTAKISLVETNPTCVAHL